MKVLIAIVFFTSGVFAKADKRDLVYQESKKLYREENYFTALDTIAQMYKFQTPDQNVQHYLEQLVMHTGTHYFNTFNDLELRKMNIPTTDLIMAKRNLYLHKFKYVHKRLKRIPKGHRLYPESLLVKGAAYHFDKKFDEAVKTFNECAEQAKEWENKNENKTKNYFAVIKESCIIDIARIHFKQGNFESAIRQYEDIPKASIKWPYILLEKAWAYYYLGNYNRSLGILITYDSPLLESYFMPEAEVLKGLNYYKLCLYEDALEIVERFYRNYKPRSDQLKKVITSQNSQLYFFNLMFKPIVESEKENKFMRNLITQVSKRVKYSLDLNSLYALNKEIYRGHPDSNMKKLLFMQQDLQEQINHYVKVSMHKFVNEIHKLSEDMFNLKLEILSKTRDLIYRQKGLSADRSRGDVKNIQRKDYQEFWTFNNAFWADELGDYTFALKSYCQEQERRRR